MSHTQVLLLSPKDDQHSTRVAILFKGVERLELDANFFATEVSWRRIGDDLIEFILADNCRLRAVAVWLLEDELEYNDAIEFFETDDRAWMCLAS